MLQSATLIVTARDTAILAVRWHSWYPANCGPLSTSRRTRVVSLVEADPGSGISFACRWSADGQAVLIRGTEQRVGHERTRGGRVQLVYAIADGRLFDITPER